MKKILNNFIGIALLFSMLLFTSVINAANITSTATGGNWNATSTWVGAVIPVAGDVVTIVAGATITVTANAACLSISINNSGNNSITTSLIINSGNTLIVGTGTGTVSIGNGTSMGNGDISTTTLTVNGILTSGTISQNPSVRTVGSGGSGNTNLTINSTGIVNVTGNVSGTTVSGGGYQGTASVIFSGAGSMNLTGLFTTSIFTPSTGTVNYNNNGSQTIRADIYYNLLVSSSGAKTVTGATVNNLFSRQGTATVTGTPTYGTSSILEYKGSSSQTTGAEFPTTGVVNLRIDNTSGVSLAGGKTISGALTLTDGVLTTTSTNLLTIDVLGSANGGSNSSFVNGPMAKVGNTAFTFPVGKTGSGGGIRTIGIAAPSVSSTFQAEFNRATAPNRGAVTTGITQVSACEHWILDRTAGTGTAAVTLSWSSASPCNGALYVTDRNDLRVARYTGTQWVNEGNASTGGDNANGTITSNTVTSFSPFALAGANSGANPLPVKFTDVKAFEKGNAVQIEWTNQTESDMVNYLVERSLNGNDFSVINTVDARSNLSSKESYISMDAAPSTGINYYRIKAVEVSGKVVYSNTVKVIKGANQQELLVYPNPVTGNDIVINFTAPKGTYNVNLFNAAGQQVMRQQLNHPGGTIAQTIGLPFNSQSGMYNLQIVGDNYRANKILIVQK